MYTLYVYTYQSILRCGYLCPILINQRLEDVAKINVGMPKYDSHREYPDRTSVILSVRRESMRNIRILVYMCQCNSQTEMEYNQFINVNKSEIEFQFPKLTKQYKMRLLGMCVYLGQYENHCKFTSTDTKNVFSYKPEDNDYIRIRSSRI